MPKALPVIDMSAPLCCQSVAAGPLPDDSALEIAGRLKALADPVRLRALSLLLQAGAMGRSGTDLAATIGVSDSTMSHHITSLRKAGLVRSVRAGNTVLHAAEVDALRAISDVIDPSCC